MRHSNCKKKVDNMQFYYKYVRQIKEYKKKRCFIILTVFVGLLLVSGVAMLMLSTSGKGNISESDFNEYIEYDNQFLEKEVKYFNDYGYVAQENIPELLNEVEDIVKEGKDKGVIEYYTRDIGNIYIKFSSGISYLFIPLEEDKLSGGEGGKILTVEPVEDSFGVRKERLVTFIDKHYNKLEYTGSFTPVGDANLIKETYKDIYEYNSLTSDIGSASYKYSLKNNEVTIDSMKKWSDSKVIIFEGHGAYNSQLHSCLVTGESFLGFEDFSKYKDDIEKSNIVLTSFPTIPGTNIAYLPVRQYCITSKFVDNYFGEMNNSLIFLGACSSAKDDIFAQELLNKGAAIVIGYNESTSMEYEMMTRSMFFYELTKVDKQGECLTVTQALDYARKSIASRDPWGGYGAELVCISKNGIEDHYTLKGIKKEHTNQMLSDMGFAVQYYQQLVSTIGLADEHIETKIETIVDQGAHTICLTPEKANLGIIFKDIADFDGNSIDDLIVIVLNEDEGKITLDQSVYFFDAEGNYTLTCKSNINPMTENCKYCFYKVGNYMVNIYASDNSGEWIDGLWYEVIENNVRMHDDEIRISSYFLNASSNDEILYIHKDYRYPDSVCYTIDDVDSYYTIYSKGFSLLSDDRCLGSESEGCDYINSLLSSILCESVGQIKPVSWDDRWNTDFFPSDSLPESYTLLKVNVSPSYKTGEKTTRSDIVINAEYVNSRSVSDL